ncbi:MAG: tetratricopeptide repeat protein [Acidobacteriota bacterium]
MLVASLHQAVAEHLPSRADFYAPWLHSESLRTPRVSVAGIRAALSFLRLEDSAYDSVVRRAGALAAEWTWQRIAGPRRGWLRMLPGHLRARAACRLTRSLAADAWQETRVATRWRRGEGTLTIGQSLFCSVRGHVADGLCGFYAAALETFLRELHVDARVEIALCVARGEGGCALCVRPRAPGDGARHAVVSILLLGLLGVTASPGRAQVPERPVPEGPRPVVMPFDTSSKDPTVAWLSEGASILITEALRARGMKALTRAERMMAFDRLEVPPLAVLSRATVLRIGMLVGASDVVVGRIDVDGDQLTVRATRVHLDLGVRAPDFTVSGRKTDLFEVFRAVARGLFAGGGAAEPDPGGGVIPTAFELYVKGLLAETLPSQVTLLQSALKAQPGYDAPRLALWQVFSANGDHAAAREAVRAVAAASPLHADAQFLKSVSLVHLGLYDEAAAVLRGLLVRRPSGEFLNNLGVIALRRPRLAAGDPPASEWFAQAAALDPADADYLYNLGYAYWREGRQADALLALREAVRVAPADGGAHALVAQVLQAGGQSAEARRELELAQRLSSDFDEIALDASGGPVVPRRMARLKTDVGAGRGRVVEAVIASAGQQGQEDTARFYLERGRRLYEDERDRDAERDLSRVIYLTPYDAEAHLLLGRVYLRTGRVRESIDALKISSWCEETADAQATLAEAYLEARDEALARSALQRALALDPEHEGALRLAERISRGPGRQAYNRGARSGH